MTDEARGAGPGPPSTLRAFFVRGTEGDRMDGPRMYSAGGVAREVGCAVSTLQKLERIGAVPRAERLDGSGRRVYTPADVEAFRAVVEARRRKYGRREASATDRAATVA